MVACNSKNRLTIKNQEKMFTVEQIKAAHSKVKSGADFPSYIKEIKLTDKIRSKLTESHIVPMVTLLYKFAKVVVNRVILAVSALGAFSLSDHFFKFLILVVENL